MSTPNTYWRAVVAGLMTIGLGALATSNAWSAADHQPSAAPTRDAGAPVTEDLSIGDAIILGVVEGVTEYLPVSSTGHLVVTEKLLGLGKTPESADALDWYTVIIQVGAILAVLALYWRRILELIQGLIGRSASGRKLLINILIAFAPAVVLGLALGDKIDEKLLKPSAVAVAWLVGGVAILALVGRMRTARSTGAGLDSLTTKSALIIGLVQCVSLWPGVSRSLVTILAGVILAGLSLSAAVEFSFLLGLLTLTGATALVAMKHGGDVVDRFGTGTPLLGIVVAGATAFIAVRSLVAYLNRKDLTVFGWYRVVIGVVTLVLVATHAGSF
jgi:undecaprenyl-diphosphatase